MRYKLGDSLFDRYGYILACAAAFLISIKLSFAYVAIIPLVTLWLLSSSARLRNFHPLFVPLFLFLGVILLSLPFGISPHRSISKFGSLAFFALTVPAYCEVIKRHSFKIILFPLIAGQTVAALDSILEGGISNISLNFFLGKVTESGQLALVIPATIGLVAHHEWANSKKDLVKSLFICATNLLLCISIGLHTLLNWLLPINFLLLIEAVLIFFTVFRAYPFTYSTTKRLVVESALPLLLATLLINLKRGPWAGVLIAVLLLFAVTHRRLIMPMIIAILVTFLAVEPVRTRLLESSQHFFIAGGRNSMWQIGSELALRYPIGIGYRNSPFLRKFDSLIPAVHNHFHNNFLNILVETGWLGLGIFIWWLARLLQAAFKQNGGGELDVIRFSIGCSLVAWQVAGLVEYNFGDAEVVQVAYILIAVLASLSHAKEVIPVDTRLESKGELCASA